MQVPVHAVELLAGVGAWFTGRPPVAPAARFPVRGNLSHRRPHLPSQLASDRADVCRQMGLEVADLNLMRQVHGAEVGSIGPDDVRGREVAGVDALVTAEPGRALVVQAADCVPVLLASEAGPVAAVHAGRRGLVAGVVEATLERLADLGAEGHTLHAVIGPAIGGCCYEVPAPMRDEVGALHPAAIAETSWGTPSLDLPAAVSTLLRRSAVADIGYQAGCTRCDPAGRWFSHRADATTGRQVGVVVRRAAA